MSGSIKRGRLRASADLSGWADGLGQSRKSLRRVARSYEYVEGWGRAVGSRSRVLRPTSVKEVRAVLAAARREGEPVCLRGGGNSYGDASTNTRGHVLDIGRMNQVLDFDTETGVAELEGGVTIAQLWRHALPRGYWPKVVSGTMFPTIAGAAAMNIHGKNNFKVGTIGDAIESFDLVLANGELVTCSRSQNDDLFHAAIGGFGMLGVMTRVRIRTHRVHSGELEVHARSSRNLRHMMEQFEQERQGADYLVGWIDCFGRGLGLGRGLVHVARYLEPGEDEDPEATCRLAHQELPSSILGFPKSQVWRFLRPICNDLGMPLLNLLKYNAGRLEEKKAPFRQPHAAFAFLLDYVPDWKLAYGPGGLIQFQSFVPKETALATYEALLERCHERGIVPYLGVFKRHRPDPFWLTHAVDGYSFAMDFKVRPERRQELWDHCRDLTEIVLDAGGRFYFAKDLTLPPGTARRFLPPERVAAFEELKERLDPDGRFETQLYRRLFHA
jgi:decaprenylphospho-beta-D-ribofuranose 2-oxidase